MAVEHQCGGNEDEGYNQKGDRGGVSGPSGLLLCGEHSNSFVCRGWPKEKRIRSPDLVQMTREWAEVLRHLPLSVNFY